MKKTRELKLRFQEKVKFLKAEYRREIQEITSSIEQKHLSNLKRDLGI